MRSRARAAAPRCGWRPGAAPSGRADCAATSASPGSTAPRVSSAKVGGSACASGCMARAARYARALLQEALDDAVLQRMEGDDDEPAALAQHRLGRGERLRQLLELAVDEDAERLEGARRRMDARRAGRAGGARDDLGEPRGAQDRLFRARPVDGAGDAPGLPLLAVDADDRGELAARRRWLTSVGGVGAAPRPCACRAGRRGGRRSRAPPRSSCIEETPTSSTTPSTGAKSGARGMRVEIGEAAFDQLQPAAGFLRQRRARLDRRCGRGRSRGRGRRAPGWRAL